MARNNVIANRYEVIQHIGQGGMADVFRAVDTILNREVAIKILRSDLNTDEISILRFEREAQAATALAHPNIVEIYDVGDYKGHHYIVMEYVPGKTLKQVIRNRAPLLNEEAIDIMKQLTAATAEAHSRGIIHRDIKPQNVIVKADGSVKILDFGIATAKGSMQLTQANNVMGSVHYLAPELAKGETASPQSDIYALGIVLYEMLSGDVPFKADQAVQVALKHMKEPMPSVKKMNPNVPQSVENIILKATMKDPVHRYRNCNEMYNDLLTCLDPTRKDELPIIVPSIKKTIVTPEEKKPAVARPINSSQSEAVTHNKEKVEKKGNNITTYILAAVILAIVAIGTFFTLLLNGIISFGPKMVTVPNVVGMTREEAESILIENNLILSSNINYELTTNVEKGKIIHMEPSAFSEVEAESYVTVNISTGKGVVADDFVAMNASVKEIQDYIVEHPEKYTNVNVTYKEEENATVTPGIIFRQEVLEANQLFNPETITNLTLVYSKYPSTIIPADIIGKPIGDAVAQLEAQGLVALTSPIDSSGFSDEELEKLTYGVVIRVEPNVGEEYIQREDNYILLFYY
ncbi:MAG: Stk1 family PASTA domain-containing Ser/Thr kinase [Solobacterium sp.]|nr:Stk1 family PASTA domain-containing Ser/Thr kinase [Solobacterium sp.]